jgi:hypothetical protein
MAASAFGQNQLLAQLPRSVQQSWFPRLELVDMPLGAVLYEAGATLGHVYFPSTSIVSLLYVMQNSAFAEIAVVGKGARRSRWLCRLSSHSSLLCLSDCDPESSKTKESTFVRLRPDGSS